MGFDEQFLAGESLLRVRGPDKTSHKNHYHYFYDDTDKSFPTGREVNNQEHVPGTDNVAWQGSDFHADHGLNKILEEIKSNKIFWGYLYYLKKNREVPNLPYT